MRAGRGLIPTPGRRSCGMRSPAWFRETRAVLRPQQEVDPASLERTFRLRSSDGFVEAVGPALLARLAVEAPGVRAALAKPDKESGPCAVASWTSRPGSSAPPRPLSCAPRPCSRTTSSPWCTRTTPLRRHLTVVRYAAARHVLVSRRGQPHSPIDEILRRPGEAAHHHHPWYPGLRRRWPWSGRAIWWRRCRTCTGASLLGDLVTLPLPFALPGIRVACSGTPVRMPIRATRWLRALIRDTCAWPPYHQGPPTPDRVRAA